MRKNLSKVLSLFLSLCMVFAIAAVPAMAEGEATITGIGTILAPPKGVLAAIPAGLVDAEGTAVASPTLTVGAGASGVYKNAQNLIIDGDAVSGGSFALTAASGDVNATQNVTVSDILYYEDFEDVTVPTAEGEYVYTSSSYLNKIDGTATATTIGTDNATTVLKCPVTNKQYASNTGITIPLSSFTTSPAVYTVEALVRNPSYNCLALTERTSANTTINLQSRESENLHWYEYNYTSTETKIKTFYDVSASGSGKTEWVKIKLIVDFINGNIKYYEGDNFKSEYTFENMKGMLTSDIKLTWEIDEILVYSGILYTSALGSITGPSIFTAPESGKYTKQPAYTLLDSSGSAVENSVISLAKSNACMKLMDNSLVVSGANVNTTPNYLIGTDSDGNFIAKKEVKVTNVKYFEDFEDAGAEYAKDTSLLTLDGSVSEKSISLSSGNYGILTEGEGSAVNHYANWLSLNFADFAAGERYLAVKFKYKKDSDPYIAYMQAYNDVNFPVRLYTTGGPYIVCSTASDVSPHTAIGNASGASTMVPAKGAVSTTEWADIVIMFDFVTGAFSMSIGENELQTSYFTNFADKNGIEKFSICGFVDDVSITTGKDFYIAQPELRLNIPGAGEEITAVTATYSDGTPAVITSITENYDGIETNGANITVSSNADVAAYTLTLSDGFVTSEVTVQSDKDYVLLNGAEVDESTALAAGSNTVKAVYGASDLASGRQVIIAHYGYDKSMKDVVLGTQTGNVIESTLTGNVESGDIIKVFTWIMNTLVPIKLVTID